MATKAMTEAQAAWMRCVELVGDDEAYEIAYAEFVAAVAAEKAEKRRRKASVALGVDTNAAKRSEKRRRAGGN